MKKLIIIAAAMSLLAACGTANPQTQGVDPAGKVKVKLQLQWFYQAQFAGFLAAVDQGYYSEQGLDVEILEGGVDIVPQTVLATGRADYAVSWVPKALASREQGAQITEVAQVFQRSGTYQVAFAEKGIRTPEDLAGKKVGNWGFGNEYELFAAMTELGMNPGKDVTLVQQQFDMQALLRGDIDAAQAMSYNEYAQVLEATNPKTGKLYQPSDFTILDWNKIGTAMLQDAIWANTQKLESDQAYKDNTVKFLAASFKGWIFCRDNADKCRDIVVAKGSKLGKSHQAWQMNEVNKLIWPSPSGIGVLDEGAWRSTVETSLTTKNADGATVLTKQPAGKAYTNEFAQKAVDLLKSQGVEVTGTTFKPATVTLNPGGA